MADRASRPSLETSLQVLGSAIGMAGGFAVLFVAIFGVFVKPISTELGWSRSEVSLMLTMSFVGYAAGSPVLGFLYDRLGARRIQAAGIVAYATSLASLGIVSPSLANLAALSAIVGFAGAATAPSGYILILAKQFERRLGLAIGMSMLGVGFGVTTMPLLAQLLIRNFGWHDAYLILGVTALVAGIIALLLGVGRGSVTAPRRLNSNLNRMADPPARGAELVEALRSWRFWLIGITALLGGGAGFGAAAHLAAALSDRGLSSAQAAGIAGIGGAGLFVGRIGSAVLMDHVFAPFVATSCCILGAFGLWMIAVLPIEQPNFLAGAALLMGLLTGSEGDTMPFLTRRYFGVAAFGSIYGCVAGLAGIGGILGPFLFGYSYDTTHGYGLALGLAAALSALSGLALLTLGSYRYGVQPGPSPVA